MAETLQERKPSYAVVRRIVRSLPAGLLMLAHRGNRAYSEGFDLVHRREALKPNSIWQVDHAQLGIKLLREDGSVGKPWLTIVIDDYSRAVAELLPRVRSAFVSANNACLTPGDLAER